MKAPPGRSHAGYRNEAVFRSAQHLLAIPPHPAAPGMATDPTCTGRKLACLGAAVALFAAGVFVGMHWRRGSAAPASTEIAPVAPDHADDSLRAARMPADIPPPPGGSSTPARPEGRSRTSAKPGAAAPASPAPPSDARPALAPVVATTRDAIAFGRDATRTSATADIAVIRPEISLRGRLESVQHPPVDFEFFLRRDGTSIKGVVRYFDSYGERVSANTVAGKINSARLVELRETGVAWHRRPISPDALPAFHPHRVFVFTLPEQSVADEFPGAWTGRIQTYTASGKLTLWFSTPW